MPKTNVDDFIDELNAGVFKQKLGVILSDVAFGVIAHGEKNRKGKVTIEMNFQKVGENDQVIITHKLAHSTPTKRGKKSEEDTTETPMFVGKGGVLSVLPPKENESGQFGLTSDKIQPIKG